jgi:hypothetical protein
VVCMLKINSGSGISSLIKVYAAEWCVGNTLYYNRYRVVGRIRDNRNLSSAVVMSAVLLYFLIHISYGQNANNSSGLTRFGHILQQLDKDTNACTQSTPYPYRRRSRLPFLRHHQVVQEASWICLRLLHHQFSIT